MFSITTLVKWTSISNHLLRTAQSTMEGRIVNISSAIVYAKAGQNETLRQSLSQLPGVEIHAATEDGKLIVTIERDNDKTAVDTYEAIERMDSVLSVAMIFQQTESNPDQELLTCK
ncbi:MAG: chaperone NapD [Rhodoferax sp.]|nr:chaperone NapD [Rhodoferax sp.]